MDSFVHNVAGVRSAADLCALICSIGLFHEPRGLYGEYQRFMRPEGQGGLWQNPLELATFLWDNKQLFVDAGVKSYLDIGTFNGFTTFVIVEFLRAWVCRDLRAKTIDPNNWFAGQETERYIDYYCQCTVDDITEEYDLVFIDGLHEEPGPSHDFDAVKEFAKLVFFHDINDRHCPYVVSTFKNLETQYESKKTCLSHGVFGIGILNLTAPVPVPECL